MSSSHLPSHLSDRTAWTDPTVETVAPGIHRAPVPMPHDGLRAINVYVIEESEGVTLIDAGWDAPVARQAVQAGLDVAGAGIGDIRQILVTHMHYDHIGQATPLVREGAGGYWLGKDEQRAFHSAVTAPEVARRARYDDLDNHGAVEQAAEARAKEPNWTWDWDEPAHWAGDGDAYASTVGQVRAIHTPGHTRGHLCYEVADRKVLFTGDHVLPHITPSLGVEDRVEFGALSDFLGSLAKVRDLDVDLVLPAHGPAFTDLAGRVDALTEHHDVRLTACEREVPLDGGPVSAATVAKGIGWTRRETPFTELDLFNQVLAVNETAIHLQLLSAQGRIARHETETGIVTWTRSAGS